MVRLNLGRLDVEGAVMWTCEWVVVEGGSMGSSFAVGCEWMCGPVGLSVVGEVLEAN